MSNTWLDLLAFQGPTGPQGPAGPSPTFAGDLTGTSASQSVIHLTGVSGDLSTPAYKGTVAESTDAPIRYGKDAVQTSPGFQVRTISTIPLLADQSSKIISDVSGRGTAACFDVSLTGLYNRIGSAAPTTESTATQVNPIGLLAGASVAQYISGNNVIVVATGPASNVDWKNKWISVDTLAQAPSTSPFITSVVPNHGLQDGTTVVQINGGNFNANCTDVKFGGVAATGWSLLSGTAIQCTPPAHVGAGAVNVVVRNTVTSEDSGTSGIGAYSYDASGPPAWNFASTGSPLGFWDAQDTTQVTQASNQLSQVNDLSGNGHPLVQATSGSQPGYNGSYNIGTNHAMGQRGSSFMNAASVGALNDFTVIIAVRPTDVSGDNTFVTCGAFNPEFGIHAGVPHIYLGAYLDGTVSVSNGTAYVITYIRSGSTYTMRVNSGAAGTGAISAAATTSNIQVLYDGSITFAKGDLAVVGVWSSALTGSALTNMETQFGYRIA